MRPEPEFATRPNVSPEQPILVAIDWIADHCEPCSPSWSCTIRAARSRTLGNNGAVRFVMAPSFQKLEPPGNTGGSANGEADVRTVFATAVVRTKAALFAILLATIAA